MKATVLDTKTGKTKIKAGLTPYMWAEGNWSCDCNRNYFDDEGEDSDTCLGSKRFLVIKAEYDKGEEEYTLEELNAEYSQELLDEFLPKIIMGFPVVIDESAKAEVETPIELGEL